MVEGFVIEGFPVVFETRELAIIAAFPSKVKIIKYGDEEEEE